MSLITDVKNGKCIFFISASHDYFYHYISKRILARLKSPSGRHNPSIYNPTINPSRSFISLILFSVEIMIMLCHPSEQTLPTTIPLYYISHLVRTLWLVNFAGRIRQYGPLFSLPRAGLTSEI